MIVSGGPDKWTHFSNLPGTPNRHAQPLLLPINWHELAELADHGLQMLHCVWADAVDEQKSRQNWEGMLENPY